MAGRRRREGAIPRPRSRSRWSASTWTCKDSYMSLTEALRHAGIRTRTRVNIHYFDSEDIQTARHGVLERRRRDPRAGRVRRARHRRQDRGREIRAREAGAVSRHLPRVAGRRDRVRAPRRRAARRALDGAQRANAASRDRADHGVARPRRHDEGAQREPPSSAARCGSARKSATCRTARSRKRSTARARSRSAIATATNSTTGYLDQLSKAGLVFSGFSQRRARRAHRAAARHASVVLRRRSSIPEFTSNPRDGHPLFTSFINAARACQGLKLPRAVRA